ncbi:hypothetical protein [Streptomyces sp. CAU 1734]|uniref:hypothetical protein n=1 Tax=Streptomyces sp. CAU 1734 TaxID=3140360 RepID=UPI00326172DB
MNPDQEPPSTAALAHPPTSLGHRKLVLRRRVLFAANLAAGVAFGYWVMGQPSSRWAGALLITLTCYTPCLFVAGLALSRTRRVARILSVYEWRAYPVSHQQRSPDSPRVITVRFAEESTLNFRVTLHSGNLARKQNTTPHMIWFAGDPRYGGVVSPVGGHFPVRVVPESPRSAVPRGTPEQDALAERAELVRRGKVRTT